MSDKEIKASDLGVAGVAILEKEIAQLRAELAAMTDARDKFDKENWRLCALINKAEDERNAAQAECERLRVSMQHLVESFRKQAIEYRGTYGAFADTAYDDCADELEAALAAPHDPKD